MTKLASRYDRHVLYELAVQDAESEMDFVCETFKALNHRSLRLLREDFSGTANTACEFVRRHEDNHAWAVDLDADVQQWGIDHHVRMMSQTELKNRLSVLYIQSFFDIWV